MKLMLFRYIDLFNSAVYNQENLLNKNAGKCVTYIVSLRDVMEN